jgi:hypothetical protein
VRELPEGSQGKTMSEGKFDLETLARNCIVRDDEEGFYVDATVEKILALCRRVEAETLNHPAVTEMREWLQKVHDELACWNPADYHPKCGKCPGCLIPKKLAAFDALKPPSVSKEPAEGEKL